MINKIETWMNQVVEEDCDDCGDCDECDRKSYISSLSNSLWCMRNDGDYQSKKGLCDGSICSDDGTEFFIHCWIMSAVSPNFHVIFGAGGVWKFPLPDYSREVVQLLIDFAYGVELNKFICEKRVHETLRLCVNYSVLDLMNHCENLMLEWLSVDNCITYYDHAKVYNLKELENHSRNVILRNFSKVYQSGENLKLLKHEEFHSLLDDDLLNVFAEEELLIAILRWVNCNYFTRNKHLPSLFSTIRAGLFRNPISFPSQTQITKTHYFNGHNSIPTIRKYDCPRIPQKLVFAFGGWCAGAASNRMEVFDNKMNSWIPSDPSYNDVLTRAYHGMALMNGLVYVLGGYDGVQCYRSVRCFNPATAQWSTCNPMREERLYVCVAVIKDTELYALGGFDGFRRKSSCERFLPSRNQWLPIAHMNSIRSDASAATFCSNKKIMVCGGFDGEGVLSSAEEYNIGTNQWTLISPLPDPRSGHQLILFRKSLYLIGGFNGTDRVSSVYRYSRMEERWLEEPSMNQCRSNFAVFNLDNRLYVVGGFDGRALISSMECLEGEQRSSWRIAPSLTAKRSALTACVVVDVPDAQRYSANGKYQTQKAPGNIFLD